VNQVETTEWCARVPQVVGWLETPQNATVWLAMQLRALRKMVCVEERRD